MKHVFIVFLYFVCVNTFAQKHDSIKYENGYLHYHEYGRGEPVIVLTGGPGAGYNQLESVALHVAKTHRAILLEQRGTGRSKPVPYDTSTINMRTALADINRVLDHFKSANAHLLGHSWGSMLAMNYAARFPERVKSLILLSSGPHKLDPAIFEVYAANREARLSLDEKKRRDEVFNKVRGNRATPEEQKEYYKWELVPVLFDRETADSLTTIINKAELNPKTGSFLMGSLSRQKTDIGAELKKFRNPIHIICGQQDPGAFLSYEMKMLMPSANLHWINRSGHFPMFERPNEFFRALDLALKN